VRCCAEPREPLVGAICKHSRLVWERSDYQK
jgi:hypothetical protein